MASHPQLHAVVESPLDAPAFVGGVPPKPWSPFVRLWGESSDGDVALVVAQLARYGHGGGAGPQSIEALVKEFPQITPGGVAIVDGATTVYPGCCCGLESWRDWNHLLRDGPSPWLGHDPSPWVEKRGEELLVWPDGGLGGADGTELRPLRLSRHELEVCLARVERDLAGYSERLRAWASGVAPASAEGLAAAFRILVRLP